MKKYLALSVALMMVPAMIQAQTHIIYNGDNGDNTDYDAFDTHQDLGFPYNTGSTNSYGVINIANGSGDDHFGSNNMLMYDLSNDDKPELQGDISSGAMLSPWTLTMKSYNNSSNTSSKAIRFRMSETGKSITSESRSAFSLSFQADGKITAKYSDGGVNDGSATDVDTKSFSGGTGDPFDNLFKVIEVQLVGNNLTAGNYVYSLHGENRTLFPQHYDVFINDGSGWDLLNSSTNVWEANGLKYHLEKSAAEYDPANGIGHFGFVGSSNSDVDPQVFFDDVVLTVIPEPATIGLLGISGVAMFITRRMRRS